MFVTGTLQYINSFASNINFLREDFFGNLFKQDCCLIALSNRSLKRLIS